MEFGKIPLNDAGYSWIFGPEGKTKKGNCLLT
jgi:hypothetical protein